MTEEQLAAMFGKAKVAELEKQGKWPVPPWLLPYILEMTQPDPVALKNLGVDLAQSFLPEQPDKAKIVSDIFHLEG